MAAAKLRELHALLKKMQQAETTEQAAMVAADLQDPAYTIELRKLMDLADLCICKAQEN